MPAVLPPALEALLRMEGRQYPNASEMEQIGMPIGVPFSNQNPGPGYRNVPDGRLSALTTMLSGLGSQDFSMPYPNMAQAPGYNPIRPEPEPYSTVMISPVSPGDPTKPVGLGSMRVPQGMEDQAVAAILRQIGGQLPSSEAIEGRRNDFLFAQRDRMAGRPTDLQFGDKPSNAGITDPARYQQVLDERRSSEAARRGVVNQRAMQVAQARTNRQSGMDPRTAALLAALGDDAGGMGGMVLADALLGKGSGLKMQEYATEERIRDKANKAAIEKETIAQGGTPGAKAPGDVASKGEAKIAEAIRGGDKAAVTSALTEEARALLADARKRGLSFRWQVDEVLNALQTKHGATLQQAQEALAAATGNDPGAFKNRTGKSDQRYKPGPGGITGEDIETTIGTPIINAWDAISGLFK